MQKNCILCPRRCRVNRRNGERGVCGQTAEVMAARAALHFWEEPCISGEEGSGAVFFSGCALHCVYCQNKNIAEGKTGKQIRISRLTEIFLELQEKGANNINLVTPGHFAPQIIEALMAAKRNGLRIPVIYNTSAYENVETLQMLEGFVDIYLPDFKYMSCELAEKYSNAPDYPETAKAAIAEMVRQTGPAVFADGNGNGLILRGTIVRHLALPGCLEDSKKIVSYLFKMYGDDIYISIMNQFTPLPHLSGYPELNRRITEEEYEELVEYAVSLGVSHGFIQEGETADESFIPEFNCEGI